MKSFLGNFNRHLVIFFWSHWLDTTFDCDGYAMKKKNPSDLQSRRTVTISAILLLQLFLLYSLGIRKFPVVHRSCKSLWCISHIFVWPTVFVFLMNKIFRGRRTKACQDNSATSLAMNAFSSKLNFFVWIIKSFSFEKSRPPSTSPPPTSTQPLASSCSPHRPKRHP